MHALLKRFFAYIFKSFHRLWLWTRPSYIKHRTPYQKRFDVKIQYTFIGCLIGMLIVAFLIYLKPRAIRKTDLLSDEYEVTQQEVFPSLHEPELAISPESEKADEEDVTPQITSTEEEVTSIELTLNQNETLSGLLKRGRVSLGQSLEACKALDLVFDTKKIRPGQNFEIFFIEDSFQGFKFEDKKGQTISVFRNKKGEFIPKTQEGIIENKRFALQGIMQDSFSVSAQKIGIPKNVIHQATLALENKIDFKKDLKQGAPFKIVYEQKMTETGKPVGKSQLLYVSLTTNKATYERYFFVDSTGVQGYYDARGQTTPQTLMKRPLGSSARISSPFGMRLHPILGYQIQHKGIDYAAKLGTPIPAGGDGVIQKIGRNGGYGKYILIKHNGTYSTAYGHLNDFADGLHVGSTVKKGEIIGFVGNTGRSTGPHLHYEVIKNKQPVSPLKTHVIPQRSLKNQSLEQFNKKRKMIDALETKVVLVEKEAPQKVTEEKSEKKETLAVEDTTTKVKSVDEPQQVASNEQEVQKEKPQQQEKAVPLPKEKPTTVQLSKTEPEERPPTAETSVLEKQSSTVSLTDKADADKQDIKPLQK